MDLGQPPGAFGGARLGDAFSRPWSGWRGERRLGRVAAMAKPEVRAKTAPAQGIALFIFQFLVRLMTWSFSMTSS